MRLDSDEILFVKWRRDWHQNQWSRVDYFGLLRRRIFLRYCCSICYSVSPFGVTLIEITNNAGAGDGPERAQRSRWLMLAVTEQIRAVQQTRNTSREDMEKIAGGSLFWLVFTRDAIDSCYSGRQNLVLDEDVEGLCEIIQDLVDPLPFIRLQDPFTLTGLGVVSLFRQVIYIARGIPKIFPNQARFIVVDPLIVRAQFAHLDAAMDNLILFTHSLSSTDWGEDGPPTSEEVWIRDLTILQCDIERAIYLHLIRIDADFELVLMSKLRLLEAIRRICSVVRNYGTRLVFAAGLSFEFLSHCKSVRINFT